MAQFASRAPRLRDRGNSMLENQLFLRAGFQKQRELVEALNAAKQFRAIDKINCDGGFLSPREIKKTILNVLWRWLCVHATFVPL